MNEIIDYRNTPHIALAGLDTDAFNALCVMGIVAGIHAGLARMFIYKQDAWMLDCGAAEALKRLGWEFILVDVPKPK